MFRSYLESISLYPVDIVGDDYAYVDRSFGGAVSYEADGGLPVLILLVMRTRLS